MHWVSQIRARVSRRLWLSAFLAGLAACGTISQTNLPSPIQITLSTPIPPFALPTPPPKTPQPVRTLRQRWLQDVSCTPPCWAGITPGQTPVQEAVEILNRHPFVSHMTFGSLPSDVEGTLVWKWTESERGSGILGFRQHAPAPIVAWISVNFAQEYSLNQITDTFGEPSHVVPIFVDTSTAHFGKTIFYDFIIVYLDHGFFLETERTFAAPPQVARDMELVGRVTFFAPTTAGLDTALQHRVSGVPWRSADLVPWQGFQDFATYCRLAHPSSNPDQMCGRKP